MKCEELFCKTNIKLLKLIKKINFVKFDDIQLKNYCNCKNVNFQTKSDSLSLLSIGVLWKFYPEMGNGVTGVTLQKNSPELWIDTKISMYFTFIGVKPPGLPPGRHAYTFGPKTIIYLLHFYEQISTCTFNLYCTHVYTSEFCLNAYLHIFKISLLLIANLNYKNIKIFKITLNILHIFYF